MKGKIWNKKSLKRLLILIAILAVPAPSLFWLPPGEVLAHGPIYPWVNASGLWKLATDHLFSWISSIGNLSSEPSGFLSYAYPALAVAISGSTRAGQALFLYFGFVGCIGGMFILARTLRFASVASLIAGVFYLLSPMVMSGMPVEITNLRVLPYYVATPILFSLVVCAMRPQSGKRELALFGIVSILLGSAGYSSLQYFVLHLILICSYIVFVIAMVWKDRNALVTVVRKSFMLFIIMFLANFYWLSQFLFGLSGAYAARAEPGFSDVDLLRGLSVKIIDGFRMLPYPHQADISPWVAFYYTPIMTLITFSLVAIAMFAFLSPKTRHAAVFPGLLLVITLFLSKGVREPLSAVGKVIFLSSPYVTRLFRNPDYFNTLAVLALALLIGLAVGEIVRIASTKSWRYLTVTIAMVTILVVIYGWQFLIGGPVNSQPQDSPSQTIKVPLYYRELAHFLREDYGIFRVASVPSFTQPAVKGTFVVYRWQNLFVGTPSLDIWSGKSSPMPLFYHGGKGINPLLDAAMHPQLNIISQDAWRALLGMANVRYVTLHKDTDWAYLHRSNPAFAQLSGTESYKFVGQNPYLKKIRIFGKIELYELDSEYFLPHIYPAITPIFVKGSIADLSFLTSLDNFQTTNGIFFSRFLKDKQKKFILSRSNLFLVPLSKERGKTGDEEKLLGALVEFGDKYRLRIPKAAKYNVLVKKDSFLGRSKDLRIRIGDKEVAAKPSYSNLEADSEWISRGEVFLEKGKYPLKIWNEGLKVSFIKAGDIVLKADNPSKKSVPPRIWFSKINPTKYVVRVSNAKDPYHLVFSESFHSGWKAYIKPVTSHQSPVTSQKPRVRSQIWETWFKKPLPESKHFMVNGYANSWYIDRPGNYEVILEFWPQRLFYLGLMISGTTLLFCLGYLGYDWRRRLKCQRQSLNIKSHQIGGFRFKKVVLTLILC